MRDGYRLDPHFVRAQIESLRVTHPSIWEDGDDETLMLALESETELREFLIAVVRQMCEADALAEGTDIELAHIKTRRQRFEQRSEAMRALTFRLMNAAEVRKMVLPQRTLSIRAGQPRVIITDETALPENCVRIKREPDKIAIKNHLMRGERINGAEMSNAEPVLAVYK